MANRVIIPLGGMSSVPHSSISQDGDMRILVNMHHKGGDLQQVTTPSETHIEGISKIFHHTTADKILGITNEGVLAEINKETGEHTELKLGAEERALNVSEVRKLVGETDIPSGDEKYIEFSIGDFTYGTLYTNGLLELSAQEGYEEVLNFASANDQPWKDYRAQIKYVKITGFTLIGDYAFSECAIEIVSIGDTVTKIGKDAFYWCANLNKIFLPPSVVEMDKDAFRLIYPQELYLYADLNNITEIFEPKHTKLYVRYGDSKEYSYYNKVEELVGIQYPYKVESVSFLGNIVVLNCDEGMKYARWNGNKYKFLGSLPLPPNIRFDTELHLSKVITREKYRNAEGEVSEDEIWAYARGGYYDVALDQLYRDGDIIDSALFRVCLRLFDGSYIASPLFYIVDNLSPREEDNITINTGRDNFVDVSGKELDYCKVYVRGMRIEWIFDNYDLSEWEDIISSVDVFTSGSIMHHIRTEDSTIGDVSGSDLHVTEGAHKGVFWSLQPDENYIKNIVDSMARMYKIASYDLKGEEKMRLKNSSPSILATQDMLSNIISSHEYIPTTELAYNARMHLGAIERKLYDGDSDYSTRQSVENIYSATEGWDTMGDAYTIVTIDSVDGETKIVKHINDFRVMRRSDGYYLSPLLMYPDARATSIELYTGITGGKIAKFKLQRHDVLNIAYYLNVDKVINNAASELLKNIKYSADDGDNYYIPYKSIGLVNVAKLKEQINQIVRNYLTIEEGGVIPVGIEEYSYQLVKKRHTGFTLIWQGGSASIQDFNLADWGLEGANSNIVESHWRAQIDLNFKRSKISSYTADIKEINLLDANPGYWTAPETENRKERINNVLYVGETDNPWHFPFSYKFDGNIVAIASSAEEVSSGQFGQYPLYVFTTDGIWAMGVDTSGKGPYLTQTPVSREVCNGQLCPVMGGIVFATDRGIMLIQGSQVTNLSAILDATDTSGNFEIQKLLNLAETDNITLGNFRQYITNSIIAYEYLQNLIIISNKDYNYSYTYSFDSGLWGVINKAYAHKTNSYPSLMLYDENYIYHFAEQRTPKPILLMTRPIKVGSTNLKRVMEAALRGEYSGKLYFYILGKDDNGPFLRYRIIGGCERNVSNTEQNLIAHCTRSNSYRYIAIAVVSPNFSGRLSCVELLLDDGIANNKLQ